MARTSVLPQAKPWRRTDSLRTLQVKCGAPAKSEILWGVSKMLTINLNDVAKELKIQ